MPKQIAYFDEPTDFSLVQGGPLFELLVRARLLKPPTDLLARRIVAILLVIWLPLLILTLASGHALSGLGVPFLYDVDAQIRCLLFGSLLIAANPIVHQRFRVIIGQFLTRGIVVPADQPQFERVIASAMRLRNSVLAEVLLIGLTVAGGSLIWKQHYAPTVPTWIATPTHGEMQFTLAGHYYFYVSLMILRFLWLRWYFRILVWYRFLWQVSRQVPLRLNGLHPDRAGGLGFLSGSVFALAPILLAHTVVLAGVIGDKIWHEGATLPQFKVEIAAWIAFLILLAVAPLFVFVTQLSAARRAGVREYGIVASRYVADFRRKWIEGHAPKGEPLVGNADIQSLADLSNSFEVVRKMRFVPIGKGTVVQLAILIALPLMPLTLTMIPIEQLIDRALGLLI